MPAPEPLVGTNTNIPINSISSVFHVALAKVGGEEIAEVISRPLAIELLALLPDIIARLQKPIARLGVYLGVGVPTLLLALFGDKVGLNKELKKDLAYLSTHELTNIARDFIHPLGLTSLKVNWEEFQKSLSLGDPLATLKSLSYIPDLLEKAGMDLSGFFGKSSTLSLPRMEKPSTLATKTSNIAPEKSTIEFRPIELKIESEKPTEIKKKRVWRFGIRD